MASHERDKEYVYDEFSEENNIIMSPTESAFGVSSSGSSSVFSTPSSDFSSPFGSEIGSTETESEDDDFISELSQLTRRMAEYTFQDDKDEFPKSFRDVVSGNSEASGFTKTSVKANSESGFVPNLISSEICSGQVLTDEQMRSVQIVHKLIRLSSLVKVKIFMEFYKRVLQTLQQHFSNAGAQSPQSSLTSCCGGGDGSTTAFPPWQNDVLARINGLLSQQKEHAEFQTRPAPLTATNHDIIDEVVVKLPQEWTY
ncbi:hypothetical protein M9H77_06033 [Catharanthus roseus]|uniref:Uncharacterized protein n=1 Tax=Catharanthus roseus TaxID=4058 RepID=A0ACC0BQY9_CATRO|nr:hypothetical protein M9H77_06033 [Catharanthus roseus]